jgi:hypothetical protein
MDYLYDPKKNDLLLKTRGVSFSMIIEAIADKRVLLNFDHSNQEKYPNQKMLVVDIEGYTYCVPYLINGNTWILKTIFPNREYKHLLEEQSNGQI